MGREFDALFDEWSQSYDSFVEGHDEQYKEVFYGYDEILDTVANRVYGHVAEFGVGTGNLTERLLQTSTKITGIEPSTEMRKRANQKLNRKVSIQDGDFFEFNVENVDCFVSTYAFHHLTDEEKERAIALYDSYLNPGGKIVFADTMFQSQKVYDGIIQESKMKGFHELAADLESEYYPLTETVQEIFLKHDFEFSLKQLNRYVWLIEATKRERK